MRREVPPVFGIWMPLDDKERIEKEDRLLNISYNIDNQKIYYKPKGIWNNCTRGKAIKAEDIKDKGRNRKS